MNVFHLFLFNIFIPGNITSFSLPYPFIAFFIRFVGELAIRRRGLDFFAHQDLHSFGLSGSSMVAILRLATGSVILQLHFRGLHACPYSSLFHRR